MKVGNENAVHRVIAQAAGFVMAIQRLAAVNQDPRLPEAIEERRVIAVGARQSVAGSEAGDCAWHAPRLKKQKALDKKNQSCPES